MKLAVITGSLGLVIGVAAAAGDATTMQPGSYEIQIETGMPNLDELQRGRSVVKQCFTRTDIESGQAYRGPRGDQYANCKLMDYKSLNGEVSYHIVCPGSNAPSGYGAFTYTDTAFRGSVEMQMGGKNMTMTQKYTAKRVANCE
jgi:hypothetical protein